MQTTPPELSPLPVDAKPSRWRVPALLALLLTSGLLIGIGVGYLLWGRDLAPRVAEAIRATEYASYRRLDVPVDDDYILGPEDAPVTIIEFSDYQCPYCQKWYVEVLNPLLAAYPGKIRFVYRDFPLLGMHPEAVPAAEAANCAGAQGKYYEFHNALFEGKFGLSQQAYPRYAAALGLNADDFEACIASGEQQTEIYADLEWAQNLGVQSTPTFFVNGIPLVGAQGYEKFASLVEMELAALLK